MAAHLEAQLRVAVEGFGQAVETRLRGLIEFSTGGEEMDVAQRHRVAQGQQVLGLDNGVDEGDALRPHGGGHDEGIEVLVAVAAVAVAAEDGCPAVGSHDEVVLVIGSVDGIAQVLHLAPGAVVHTFGTEEVHAAHACMAVGGEIERLVIEVDIRRRLVAFGVDGGAQVPGFAPAALLQRAAPDVGATVSAGTVGGEIERVAVNGERGERLPVARVDGSTQIAGFAPAATLAHTHVDVAARVLFLVASAGGEDDHATVVRDGLGSLIAVAVEGVGHAVSRAPVELHGVIIRPIKIFLFVQSYVGQWVARYATGEYQHPVVGRQRWQVFVILGVDVGSEVDGTERNGVLHGLFAPASHLEAVLRLAAPLLDALALLEVGEQRGGTFVVLNGIGIFLQQQVLAPQQQPRFGVAGVEVDGFVEQLHGLLILSHHRFLHRPLEQRLAFRCLPHRSQRQQQQH